MGLTLRFERLENTCFYLIDVTMYSEPTLRSNMELFEKTK